MKSMKTGGYTVRFSGYCGMSILLGENLSREEAEVLIRRRLKIAKGRSHVVKIGKGRWEFQTPDDAGMVSDGEGILTVEPTRRSFRVILGRRVWL